MLSRAQRLIRTGHHLSALSSRTSVNERSELTEEYFLINCTISSDSTQANTRALVNTDDFSYAFIDHIYAQSLNLTLILLSTPHALHVFNGCESASDQVTHYVLLDLLTGNHVFNQVLCYVT